jgi:hypothetical protein
VQQDDYNAVFNPLNAELNPICHLLAFAAAPYICDISRLRVNCASFEVPTVVAEHSSLEKV